MEFFGFVETFFFISLAITFVLIMMLIYHFKERITVLEKKTNTMFDILTNMVNELNYIRNISVFNHSNNINSIHPSEIPVSEIFSQLSQSYENTQTSQKIVVSEDEDYDEESDDDENDSQEDEDEIKIINIDLNTKEDENIVFEELETMSEDESLFNSVTDFEAYSNMENNEIPENSSNELKIEKNDKTNEEVNNSYRKMDINALRNLVIERGISNDIKKLKKIELIKLLESSV